MVSRHGRRHIFASALLLLTYVTTAFAVERAPDGRGEVLLFPLVIAGNGWDTYLNLRADPEGGQIVRLRFLEGRDGAVVNAFNLYLLPGENWGAAVTETGGGTVLRIAEGSCVLADTGARGGVGTEFPLDLDIGMAEAYVVTGRLDEGLRQSNCAQILRRWDTGAAWDVNPQADLEPAGEAQAALSGFLSLVNVQKGLSADLAATALRDFGDNLAHTLPGDPSPNLAEATPVAVLPDGSEWLPESGEGIDAVAKVLSPVETGAISNEVITLNSVGASTDWVVTFPLSGYREYRPLMAEVDGEMRTCSSSFEETENEKGLWLTYEYWPWYGWGGGNTAGRLEPYNEIEISPVPRFYAEPFLCHVVNIVSFGDALPVLLAPGSERGDRIVQVRDTSLSDLPGWQFRYTFIESPLIAGGDGLVPIIAFRATQFINSTLEGGTVRANYLFLRLHEAL